MQTLLTQSWSAVAEGVCALSATEIARSVALRLRECEQVHRAADLAQTQTSFPSTSPWRGYSIARGDAGLAIMCGYLNTCYPGEGWDLVAHRYLTIAAASLESELFASAALFSGVAGLAASAAYLSHGGTRYQRMLASLDSPVAHRALELVGSSGNAGLPVSRFDVISGLAGIGRYLLLRADDTLVARQALENVLGCLAELTGCDGNIPRWQTPARFIEESARKYYPAGNLNCGLAHGIPGPLSLLALAHRARILPELTGPAVRRAADWLCRHSVSDAAGVGWPSVHQLTPNDSEPLGRSAWCYGSPGVARALWLAGEALNREDYRQLAIEAMKAVFRRSVADRMIDSPTFCHGVAGTLQVTLRFVADTGDADLRTGARQLLSQLVALYDSQSILGFRHLEQPGCFTDQPGLLDGAAGVVVTLLAATTDAEPVWDGVFMLN